MMAAVVAITDEQRTPKAREARLLGRLGSVLDQRHDVGHVPHALGQSRSLRGTAFPCRAEAPDLAISTRRRLLSLFALANPPLLPSSMAALLLPSSVVPASSISPVAIFMTWTALLTTSAGRLWPFGVFAIYLPLSIQQQEAETRKHPRTA